MNEKCTLIQLLTEYEVQIPIIQRDYAQGRKDEKAKEVRKNLIRDIKNCLKENGTPIDFNFIYGTSEETESNQYFYPIDGQQRLTTLYLLHWYLACFDDENTNSFQQLKSFSYKTRNSASEFFAILKEFCGNIKEIVQENVGENSRLRECMENQAWFQVEWSYDPTVNSALTLLDELSKEVVFRDNASNYYKKLNSAIYFTKIIENSEEAETIAARSYIRMNARGKALELFENIKAMLDSIEEKCRLKSCIYEKEEGCQRNCIYWNHSEGVCEKKGCIYQYDISYINILFEEVNGYTLHMKTEAINRQSLNCFINIYLLLCRLRNFGKTRTECLETEFASEMFEYSQEVLQENEIEFFREYFDMVMAVFEYYSMLQNKNTDIISEIFGKRKMFALYDTAYKKLSAAMIYIYSFYRNPTRKYQSVSQEKLKMYLYVLENLNYDKWEAENFLTIAANLSEKAAEKEDILDYFAQEEALLEVKEILKNCGLDDYEVRIKEQHIKAKICKKYEWNWNFFADLEEKANGTRKISYLLYISGYWKNNEEGDIQKLYDYKEIANNYFGSLRGESLKTWSNYYAVAVHIRSDGTLENADIINTNCGKCHIWSDSFYFWNDEAEKQNTYERNVEYIGWIYEELRNKREIVERVTQNDSYKKCWLYYGLLGKNVSLLNCGLEWNSQKEIVYVKEEVWNGIRRYRYDVFFLMIEKYLSYGLEDFSENRTEKFLFKRGVSYNQIGTDDYQNYTMTISCNADILNLPDESYGEMNSILENYVYYFGENEKTSIYQIYEAIEPYRIRISKYDITKERKLQREELEKVMQEVVEVNDWITIRVGRNSDWYKQDARSHTWWYKEEVSVSYQGQEEVISEGIKLVDLYLC